jgi:hypothetical protein
MTFKGYKQTKEHKEKKAISKRRGSFFKCLICNTEFWRSPAAIKKGQCKFCSKKCYQEWQKGRTKSEIWKNKRKQGNIERAKIYSKGRLF